MTDKLVIVDPFHRGTVESAVSLSANLAKSQLMPDALRNKPQDVLAIVLAGHELGLGPMQSIRGIYIVQGKPVLSADLMLALVQRDGQCKYMRVVETTDKIATYETLRSGHSEPTRLSFTIDDAKAAGLTGKGTWKSYPAAMLRARAAAAICRMVYPDLLFGVYERDELEEPVAIEHNIADAQVTMGADELSAAIKDCESSADLERLLPDLKALPEGEKAGPRALYKQRLTEIEKQQLADLSDVPQ